ncbi:MAG: type VI secretion system Vgr family protein, partial [Paracoccus sp. (in: a-proteobacteria)]
LGAGKRMTLSGDRVPGHGETFICLSASHHFVSEAYGSGGQGSDGYSFTGSYVLMPDTAPMAPPKRTPLAVVQGPQTAMVVGEDEVDCDEYGRILVRFHWDLDKAYSMRCRVSQNWAGAGWGGMVIPRIGMEVVVEFLEGDPDKPLVTGNVFNGKNDVPYDLPKHKTRSTFRTNTHNGKHTGRGYNELRFEDQEGEEEIFVHAEKDRNEKVKNNHTERIDRHWVQSIGGNKLSQVERDSLVQVDGNLTISTGKRGNSSLVSTELSLMKEGIGKIGPSLEEDITPQQGDGHISIMAEKSIFASALKSSVETVGKEKAIHSGNRILLKSKNFSEVSSDKIVKLEAAETIMIICGEASIMLRRNGEIDINGTNINIEALKNIIALASKINLN